MIKNPSAERYRKEAKRLRALAAATRFADIRERFVLIARDYLSLADVAEAEATYGSAFAAVAGRHGHKTIVLAPQGGRLLIELRDDAYFCRPYSRKVLLQIIERRIQTSRSRTKKKLGFLPAPLRPMLAKLRAPG